MSKPQPILVPDKDYFAWEYEEQTRVKHRVLQTYGKIWLSKLGAFYETLFVDCHGGCGAYLDPKTNELFWGSSILIDKTATEVNALRKNKNYICVCEREADNIQNLQKVWGDQGCSNRCRFKNDDFNNVIREERFKKYYQSHPSLFFVDPFGYDLKMDNLSNLMVFKGSELIINFMYDWISRFLSRPELEGQLTSYFGSKDWKKAIQLRKHEREMYLVDLYKANLKRATGAKFVFAYKMNFPSKDQTYYYLIHATNDIQGITHMKNAFASVNNGHIQYLGRKNNNYSLFDLDAYKQNELEPILFNLLSGKTITFAHLWETIVEDTALLEKDLRTIIKNMEMELKVEIKRISSKKTGLKENDQITFKAVL